MLNVQIFDNFYEFTDNPHEINPKKGYIVACNNRISYPNAFDGIGSTFPSTIRAKRAANLIKEKIANKEKLTVDFMKEMQADIIDEFATVILSNLLKIVNDFKEGVLGNSSAEYQIVTDLVEKLKAWNKTDMLSNDKNPLIYNIWIGKLYYSILQQKSIPENYIETILNYFEYTQQYLGKVVQDWNNNKRLKICANFYKEPYSNKASPNKNKCATMIIASLLDTFNYINEKVGKNMGNWKWGNHNILEFRHLPFSDNFLKTFFHREIPIGVYLCYLI